MFSVDYYVFFDKINNFKEKNLFFFSYDEPFLMLKGIDAVMKLKGINRKRIFLGKEFSIRDMKNESRNFSMFGEEKNINLIFNADGIRFTESFKNFNPDSPCIFVFNDKKNFERNRILNEMEDGVYVHFPKVDYNTAFRWLKKELRVSGKIFPDSQIMSIVRDNEGSLTKLKNIVELIKLGANFENFIKRETFREKEMDAQSVINLMVFLMRRKIISPDLIWKIYEPLLYNRRVNYDYEIELKQILRRHYERRNKY